MSWWISIRDNKDNILETPLKHEEGGTFALGGTNDADLNVTYNYGKHFDFKQLDGLPVIEAEKLLWDRFASLKDDSDADYWKPTEGNTKKAIELLLRFVTGLTVKQRETAVFYVN